ncbi:MAG: hypothetical protein RLN76_06155 [Phycisphaeraceae bacterium]
MRSTLPGFLALALFLTTAPAHAYLQIFPQAATELEGPSELHGIFSDGFDAFTVFASTSQTSGYITKFDGSSHTSAVASTTWNATGFGPLAASPGSGVYTNRGQRGGHSQTLLFIINPITDRAYQFSLFDTPATTSSIRLEWPVIFPDPGNIIDLTDASAILTDSRSFSVGAVLTQDSNGNIIAGLSGPIVQRTSQQILNATGSDQISAMTYAFDPELQRNAGFGDLFVWASDETNELYIANSNNTDDIDTLLPAADLLAHTNETSAAFSLLFFGGDDLLYFNDLVSQAIYRLDPLAPNPADTLETILTRDQLLAGPAATTDITNFTWHNDTLAWAVATGPNPGFYQLPEPTSAFAFLLLTGLTCRRAIPKNAGMPCADYR